MWSFIYIYCQINVPSIMIHMWFTWFTHDVYLSNIYIIGKRFCSFLFWRRLHYNQNQVMYSLLMCVMHTVQSPVTNDRSPLQLSPSYNQANQVNIYFGWLSFVLYILHKEIDTHTQTHTHILEYDKQNNAKLEFHLLALKHWNERSKRIQCRWHFDMKCCLTWNDTEFWSVACCCYIGTIG